MPAWCFLLPREWRDLRGKSLPEIAAFQWAASSQAILDGLSVLQNDRWATIDYEELIADPASAMDNLSNPLGVEIDGSMMKENSTLPLSRTTISPPEPDKWKRHSKELKTVRHLINKTQIKIDDFIGL